MLRLRLRLRLLEFGLTTAMVVYTRSGACKCVYLLYIIALY
jgi:hypothetical protein